MLNIYYCPTCGKFHFADEIGGTETYHKKCSHCFSDFAINTQKSKAEYDAMDDVAKNEFKNSIKESITLSNVKDEILNLETKKKEEEWLVIQEATGIRHELVQRTTDAAGTYTVTTRFYDDRIVHQTFHTLNTRPTDKVWFVKDIVELTLTLDQKEAVNLEAREAVLIISFILKQGEFEYNRQKLNSRHYESMKAIFDFLVNQIAKFKQPPM